MLRMLLTPTRAAPPLCRAASLRSPARHLSRHRAPPPPPRPALARPRSDEQVLSITEVRLISEDGSTLGVLPSREALDIAKQRGFHLLEVRKSDTPPVWRLVDELQHLKPPPQGESRGREKKERKKPPKQKEVRLTDRTEDHDLAHRSKLVRVFLSKGMVVKLAVLNTGRTEGDYSRAEVLISRVAAECEDVGKLGSISGAKDARIDETTNASNPILGLVTGFITPLAGKNREKT
ncbi:hypothetical protein AB1Y20_014634 [Prymnesium parvum]|uniref:Translation initiation factor IF-3 n=1 Tax=Prymnesium parvum TaxID=97485 RepID=A0AB34IC04_PRYPA